MAELRGCTFPDDRLYHPESHLWFVERDDGVFEVGVTPFGIAIVGEILMFSPKPAGAEIEAGRAFGLLEACKTVFPVRSPFAARLIDGNESLMASGEPLMRAPYDSWLARLLPHDPAAARAMLAKGPVALAGIAAQMDLYRFIDAAGYVPPAPE